MSLGGFSSASPRRYACSALSPTACARAASATSRGNSAQSPHQSRNVDWKPCVVRSPRPILGSHRHVRQRLARLRAGKDVGALTPSCFPELPAREPSVARDAPGRRSMRPLRTLQTSPYDLAMSEWPSGSRIRARADLNVTALAASGYTAPLGVVRAGFFMPSRSRGTRNRKAVHPRQCAGNRPGKDSVIFSVTLCALRYHSDSVLFQGLLFPSCALARTNQSRKKCPFYQSFFGRSAEI
jgi:hypothetical protein